LSKIKQKAELLHRAIQLYNDGYKVVSISRELNIHVSTVRRWLRSAGVMAKTSRYDKNKKVEEDEALQKAFEEEDIEVKNEAEEKLEECIKTHDEKVQETKDIEELAEAQSSPAEQYQAYMAASGIQLLKQSLKNIKHARTIKDLDVLDQMIRRNLNIDKKTGVAGSMHIDISILNGSKKDSPKVQDVKIIDVETLEEKNDG
tara:strand:+ start:2927 stop:3532 length:606 start_codon:yes stop_codon:yes gene_type:complete